MTNRGSFRKNKKSKQNVLFKLIAISLPIVALLLVEVILRIAGYGNDLSLFLTDQTGKYYYMNPQIGKRYFTQEVNATDGNIDFFKKEKTPGIIRIFVLGSSTALGFPYMFNGAFPRMLNYRIQRNNPEAKIEIINLSLSAINSYAVLDIAKELDNYQPDMVLIYTGQNEYHGTLGIASSSKFGNHPFLIELFIYSKQSRLMQLIYHAIYDSKKVDRSTNLNLTLMERLASGQQIPFGSKQYEAGLTQFERNMNKILDQFTSRKTPVFVGTLTTNERGIHPFMSQLADSTKETEWNQLFAKGQQQLKKGDTLQAMNSFLAANKLDSTYAECQFQLGNTSYSQGHYMDAKKYYINAKELDQLRFRAPEAFNRIIRKVASGRPSVVVTDVAKAFEMASPHHIVGKELLLEHVHPNLTGYHLMADAFYQSMTAANVIPATPSVTLPENLIYEQTPLSRFDTIFGYISTILLKENWPFNEQLPKPTMAEQTYEGKVAGGFAVRQYSWNVGMEKLYNYYVKNKDYPNALRIAEGECLEFPYTVIYFERAAKLAQSVNDQQRALFYLEKIWLNFVKNNEIAQQLVLSALKLDDQQKALSYINYLIINSSSNQSFVELRNDVSRMVELKKQISKNPGDVGSLKELTQLYQTTKELIR